MTFEDAAVEWREAPLSKSYSKQILLKTMKKRRFTPHSKLRIYDEKEFVDIRECIVDGLHAEKFVCCD